MQVKKNFLSKKIYYQTLDIEIETQNLQGEFFSEYRSFVSLGRFTPRYFILLDVSAGEGVEIKEPYDTVGGIVNWHNHCGKQDGDSSEN